MDFCIVVKMSKIEYRFAIGNLFLKKISNDDIKNGLNGVYGDSALSFLTIKYRAHEFRAGGTSIFDHPGRPRVVTAPELLD